MKKSFLLSKLVFCGLVLAGLSARASESDVRFGGGHPWLSKSYMMSVDVDTISHVKRAGLKSGQTAPKTSIAVYGHELTVSMYRKRTKEERLQIGSVITNFALAVYEATEGKHVIGKVTIFEDAGCNSANIVWKAKGEPNAVIGSNQIKMFDVDSRSNKPNYLEEPLYGGFALAHEMGHAHYGFGDEYKKVDGDVAVEASLMSPTFEMRGAYAERAFIENSNLSIAYDETDIGGKWRNTRHTDHHRLYGQSCMQQLVTPKNCKEFQWVESLSEEELSYFKGKDINPHNKPSLDLLKDGGKRKALANLRIIWPPDPRLMWGICLDHSTSMSANDLASAKANAQRAIDMAPAGTLVGVFAFGSDVETIFNYTEVTDANRSSLKTKIDSISLRGSTALWKAADVALNAMNTLDPEHNNIGSLLLLTDGGDNASGSITKASVVSKCLEMGVAFNSISYGNNADANLGATSSATGGRNVSASGSLSSLNNAFSRLLTYGSSRGTIADEKGSTSSSQTFTKTFVVDSSVADLQATVTLSVPSASATVSLISPSGTSVKVKSTVDVGNESTFVFMQPRPVAGTWKVTVKAPSGTKVSCYLDASAGKEPPRLSVRSDDNLLVYALLTYGVPVDGATVKAVFNDGEKTREVPFEPIGGGTYRLDLADCGMVGDGFTVRADAVKGVATYTYVGVFDHDGDGEGTPIPESFTRSEWFSLGKGNETSFFASGKGMLEFRWRTSGSGCPSAIQFLHNENAVDSLSSGQGWRKAEFAFDEEGSHVFKWRTSEDSSLLSGSWLKNVIWHPEPDVRMSSLVATPRWPWNGLVDIDFSFVPTIAGTKATFSISGVDGDLGKTVPAKTLSGAYRNLGEGNHRVTWNLGADSPAFHSSSFTVVLDAKVEPFEAPSVKVSNLTVANGVGLEWPSVSPCATYTVFRASNASGTDATAIGTVSASKDARAYWDSTAPYGQTVWYAVKASAWHLDGVRSAFVRARRPMNYPSTLAATEGSRKDGVLVSWTPSTGATRSRIFRQVTDFPSSAILAKYALGMSPDDALIGQSWGAKIAETTGSSWLDTTALPGVDYIYAVSCVSSEGEASPLPTELYSPYDYEISIGLAVVGNGTSKPKSTFGAYPAFGRRGIGAPVIISATREDNIYDGGSPYYYVPRGGSSSNPSSSAPASDSPHQTKALVVGYGLNGSSTYKVSWKPVEGAKSYKIEHWGLDADTSAVKTTTIVDCSFKVVDAVAVFYPKGRRFRITPLGEKYNGESTEVEIVK